MQGRLPKKEEDKVLTADSRGRIGLGTEVSGQSFTVRQSANGDYILTPVIHVPAREAWLSYENESRASFERGIADMNAGRVEEVDFSRYLTPEDIADAEEAAEG